MTRRTVMVTGGSRGIGAELVEAFLHDGDHVATCSRSVTDRVSAWMADAAYAERFMHSVVDMADRTACATFVRDVLDRFGAIDVLVNNAGVANASLLALARDTDIDEVIDLNLKATITMSKLVTRRMLVRGEGRVINISSVVGLAGYRGLATYGATKAALDGFTRALARELGPRGITVNSVAPGYLRTEMSHGLTETNLEQISRRTPLGRLGTPADVAAAVRFLASPEAGFISGHVLVVDGGLTA